MNGAGFFATGGPNYGAFSPCSIGTLVIGSGTFDPGAVALQPSLYGAPMRYEYPYGYALYFNQEGAMPNANTESAPILSITGLINQTLVTFPSARRIPHTAARSSLFSLRGSAPPRRPL